MRYSEEKIMEMLDKCRVDLSNQDIIELINSKNDLINRQQADYDGLNERFNDLLNEVTFTPNRIKHIKADAIKEFADRLKEKHSQADILCPRRIVSLTEKALDNLVKEMVGED